MLQFITNAPSQGEIVSQVRAVLDGGCRWIQLRMKGADHDSIAAVARELKPLCKEHEAILVVDDHVELCKELELDGVHLGKTDMPVMQARKVLGENAIIGATANTFADIASLPRLDVDYVGVGPFRFTTTKQNLSPVLGLDGYRTIMEEYRKSDIEHPIVAIGGITLADIEPIMATGVHGVAVSGSIINSTDPTAETRRMVDALNEIVVRRMQE